MGDNKYKAVKKKEKKKKKADFSEKIGQLWLWEKIIYLKSVK